MKTNEFHFTEELCSQSNRLWKTEVTSSGNSAAKGERIAEVEQCWDEVSQREPAQRGEDIRRIEDVLAMLQRKSVLAKGKTCLDVGCGRGTFALPFARHGMVVDCFDLSQGMLDDTARQFIAEGLPAPRLIKGDWQCADLHALYQQYDLVFSSLNPAVTNPESIDRMTDCSKKWCMYLYSAGGWLSDVYTELDEILLGKPAVSSGFNEICFPFNHLYCHGFQPIVDYTESSWDNIMTPAEATDRLCTRYARQVNLDGKHKKMISDYVAAHSPSGEFVHHIMWKMGIVMWHV